MPDNDPDLRSFIGDIKKVLHEISDLGKTVDDVWGVVSKLPGEVAAVPSDVQKLYREASSEFDKANPLRADFVKLLHGAEDAINGTIAAGEKMSATYEAWKPGAENFRGQLTAYFDDIFATPDYLKKVDFKRIANAEIPIDVAKMGFTIPKTIVDAIIVDLPDILLYPIYLGVAHDGEWQTVPQELNSQLGKLAELSTASGEPPSVKGATIACAILRLLAQELADICEVVSCLFSRDVVAGVEIVGEGFEATMGPQPLQPVFAMFKAFFLLVVNICTAAIAILGVV